MFDESFAPLIKSRHRFARQNVLTPPARFPMPSSCSIKVHTLSGRTLHAILKSFTQRLEIGRWCRETFVSLPTSDWQSSPLLSLAHRGFYSSILACKIHSLVRVTRRGESGHFNNVLILPKGTLEPQNGTPGPSPRRRIY